MKIFKVVVLLVILSGKCISQTKQPNSPLIEKISSILFNRSRDFVFIVLPVYFDNSKQQQNLVTDNFAVRKYLQFKDSLLFKNKSKLDSLISNVLIEKDKLIIRKDIWTDSLKLGRPYLVGGNSDKFLKINARKFIQKECSCNDPKVRMFSFDISRPNYPKKIDILFKLGYLVFEGDGDIKAVKIN